MHDVGGVRRKETVWIYKVGATTLPIRRCLVFIPGSFEQILLSSYRRVLAFLTETASHSESSVNHLKQTSVPFLTGARIVTCVLDAATFFAAFLTQIAIRVVNPPWILPPKVVHNLFLGLMLDSEMVFL
jgi:hypothetical protein